MTNEFKGKKVVITGGLGFIGSNLAETLVDLGANVFLVDSMLPSYGGNEFNIARFKDKVSVSFTDLRDKHALPFIVKNSDYIFNLAGQISHMDSMSDPIQDLEINQLAQLYFLESVKAHSSKSIVVYASTRQLYGRTMKTPTDESHPCHPTDVNGVNKLGGEMFHILYHRVHGLKTVAIRLTNTYGPRQLIKHSRQGFIAWFMNRSLLNENISLFGDGSQVRDFTYIDDAVDAFLKVAVNSKCWGEIYNLGGLRPYTLKEVANILQNINPKLKVGNIPFPDERKKIDIGNYIADWSKIKRDTGWVPKVTLEDGLNRMYDYYVNQDVLNKYL